MNIRQYSLILIASGLVGGIASAQSPTPATAQPIVKAAAAPEKTAKPADAIMNDQKTTVTKTVVTDKQAVEKTAATHKHHTMSKKKVDKSADATKTAAVGAKAETTKVDTKTEVKTEAKTTEPASKTAAVVKAK